MVKLPHRNWMPLLTQQNTESLNSGSDTPSRPHPRAHSPLTSTAHFPGSCSSIWPHCLANQSPETPQENVCCPFQSVSCTSWLRLCCFLPKTLGSFPFIFLVCAHLQRAISPSEDKLSSTGGAGRVCASCEEAVGGGAPLNLFHSGSGDDVFPLVPTPIPSHA